MLDLEPLKVYFKDMNWVLIRGLVSEEFHWGDFVPLMKKHFKNDSVFTADIIGNGKSHNETLHSQGRGLIPNSCLQNKLSTSPNQAFTEMSGV